MIRTSRAKGARVTKLQRVRLIGVGVGLGAIVSYLFDPDRGHARRARARDQYTAAGRRVRRRAEHATLGRVRHARDHAGGVVRRGLHTVLRERPDDATLAQKVRSEVLGPRPVRGVSVDASNGVVHLRGELAAQALIDELTAETAQVYGVEQVESYLHLPGEAAPNKQSALAQRPSQGS